MELSLNFYPVNSPVLTLPKILQKSYSQWVCRGFSRNKIVFRGINFGDRDIKFLMLQVSDVTTKCIEIPINLRSQTLQSLSSIKNGNNLIMNYSSKVIDVLSKFESKDYILILFNDLSKNFIFSLPRYNLKFELRVCGKLYSLNFTDYILLGYQLSTV